jgi:hypothetical protein
MEIIGCMRAGTFELGLQMETDGGSSPENATHTIGDTRKLPGKEWFDEECGKLNEKRL